MIRKYIAIARPDHWVKNIFVLPGAFFALAMRRHEALHAGRVLDLSLALVLGLLSVCLVASANYIINEWLDREFDRFHPLKKARPSVAGGLKAGWIACEYLIFMLVGLLLAALVSTAFFWTAVVLLVMGIIYNVKPFRTKDRVFLDVLTESVNNGLRLLLGWFIVDSASFPPSSLITGYWMGGAFLMAIKRYSEFRFINDKERAGLYRKSFIHYTEQTLLSSAFFYALCSLFLVGIFLVKHRIELLLSIPPLAILFTAYFYMGLKGNSSTQHPEHLYQEKMLITLLLIFMAIVGILMVVEIPQLQWFLNN